MCGLDDILNAPVNGSGCNEAYGLLGSNKSTENTVKLFPRDCGGLVLDIQKGLLEKTGKQIEVMVYGDGAVQRSGWADLGAWPTPAYRLRTRRGSKARPMRSSSNTWRITILRLSGDALAAGC